MKSTPENEGMDQSFEARSRSEKCSKRLSNPATRGRFPAPDLSEVLILDVQGWSSGCGKPSYYNERVMEGTVKSDSGAQIRDGIKSVGSLGACPETDWAYDITKFAEKPPQPAFKDAPLGKALQYERVPQVLSQMKGCLAAGYPFVFGIYCV
jgi:hypothetical protein